MSFWHKLQDWFEDLKYDDDPHTCQVTVHSGDSLWKITQEATGQGDRWHELATANPDRHWDKDYTLQPGEKLRLPKTWLPQRPPRGAERP